MISGSLALLYFLLGFHGGRQGSSPNRGQSPVEWGDFLYIRPSVGLSVCPYICLSPLWVIQPGLRPSQPGLRPSQPDPQVDHPGPLAGFQTLKLALQAVWLAPRPSDWPHRRQNLPLWYHGSLHPLGPLPHNN